VSGTPTPEAPQTNGARSRLIDNFPLFSQLSSSPATIGTNLALSLLLLFLILLACSVFNQTLEENHDALATRFAATFAPFGAVLGWLGHGEESIDEGTVRWASLPRLALILAIVGAIYSGLDPDFGLNRTTLALVISLTVGVGLLTTIYEGSQILLSSRAFGARGSLELEPLGILIAIASVLLTRITSLHPGIVLGVIAGAVVSAPDTREQGKVVLGAMVGMLVMSMVALLLVEPLRSVSNSSSEWYAVIPETVAVTLFVGGVEGLLFNLLPLEFMEGRTVWRWSRRAWLLLTLTVVFVFFHVVVNRTDSYTSVAEATGVRALFAIAVVCVLLASAFWLFCRYKFGGEEPVPEAAEP
jgi:hypothetical protein